MQSPSARSVIEAMQICPGTFRRAASLVEMLVVMAIILLLLGMLLSVVTGAVRAAKSLRGQAGPPAAFPQWA